MILTIVTVENKLNGLANTLKNAVEGGKRALKGKNK